MLVVEGLVKRFGTRTVLDELALDVAAGEYVAIVGESGSGKSTLLNLIAGLEQPDSGTVAVDGANIARMNDEQRTLTRRSKVGFVFQSVPHQPIESNVGHPDRCNCHQCRIGSEVRNDGQQERSSVSMS